MALSTGLLEDQADAGNSLPLVACGCELVAVALPHLAQGLDFVVVGGDHSSEFAARRAEIEGKGGHGFLGADRCDLVEETSWLGRRVSNFRDVVTGTAAFKIPSVGSVGY